MNVKDQLMLASIAKKEVVTEPSLKAVARTLVKDGMAATKASLSCNPDYDRSHPMKTGTQTKTNPVICQASCFHCGTLVDPGKILGHLGTRKDTLESKLRLFLDLKWISGSYFGSFSETLD